MKIQKNIDHLNQKAKSFAQCENNSTFKHSKKMKKL
jgi:hypothetical protein